MPKGDSYILLGITFYKLGKGFGSSVTFTDKCGVRNYTQSSVKFTGPVENRELVLHIL